MSNQDKIDTFFPNQRKHMKVLPGGTGPAKEGDVRLIRLGLKMGLNDGKLTGMPDYIAQAYSVLAKEGSILDAPKLLIELTGMNVSIFAAEKSPSAAIVIENCTLHGFSMVREVAKREGEAPPLFLRLSLKTNGWIPKLWTWLGDNFQSEFWMGFEGSHMTLNFTGSAEVDDEDEEVEPAQMTITAAERLEAERKEATSPAPDTVFGKPVPATTRPKSVAAKRAEEALNGKGPALVH